MEWTTSEAGEAWSVPVAVKILVEGSEVKTFDEKPSVEELRNAIIEAAKTAGLSRFYVKLNGEQVGPADFERVYNEADTPIVIEIVKADFAG